MILKASQERRRSKSLSFKRKGKPKQGGLKPIRASGYDVLFQEESTSS
jgi:hypothetical protein